MPEYLAPGVYLEEVDTGSKPIEGVSTSTAGMIGVTERGPVNVPILITSFREYTRWFGGYLDIDIFSNDNGPHCYLPHAVEGFFTNGGKRVYIVRVLNTEIATYATNYFFDRETTTSVTTSLLRAVAENSADIYLANRSVITVDTWLQIGEGSEAEYRQVSAINTRNEVSLRLPSTFTHNPATPVHHLNPEPLPALIKMPTPVNLDVDAFPGDINITLSDVNALNAAGGDLLLIGKLANGDDEYVFTDSVDSTTNEVTLRTQLKLFHITAPGIVQLMDSGTQTDSTQIAPSSILLAGEATLFLDDNTGYITGDFLLIDDVNNSEVHRIGKLGTLNLGVGAYANYSGGSIVEAVNLTDDPSTTDKTITAEVNAGSNVIALNNRENLNPGDLLRIGDSADIDVEYLTIRLVPNRLPSPDAGNVVLQSPLQRAHIDGITVREQAELRITPPPSALALTTQRNSSILTLSGSNGYVLASVQIVKINEISGTAYYHRITADADSLTPSPVTLNNSLSSPHPVATPVSARNPLLLVRALDQGAWGDRIRITIQDQNPPLVSTQIREIIDDTHIRLNSVSGIEAGTILQRTDTDGNLIDTPFKVIKIDRQADYLVTLDDKPPNNPLPGGAIEGDSVRSLEFQMDVILLRQPDPGLPTRNDTVLDSESFRYLSMDPRNSRYIEKIIGTTWNPNATEDNFHPSRPLRLEDRRSEGESRYIRIHDLAQDLTEPDRTDELESIRIGPEALVDKLPDGTAQPARRALRDGFDAISAPLTDTVYIGENSPEPLNRTGLHSLRNEEDISIVACPGRTGTLIQSALIQHCESMRFRVAVLDAQRPPKDSLNDVQVQRGQFDTKYAAIYHPWLLIRDPFPDNLSMVMDYPIPPSGQVIGVFARTDIERGVHKAPANEVVRGILGLQRTLKKGEQDILNPFPVNINVVRDFRPDNRGIRVFGGRIITSDPDWKYVNVRRLLIFIESSIERGLQWVVFEPNAEPLWARVRRTISNFLTVVWRNGALEGTKPEEAYFVKCDRTTMTQTDIDNGRLICVIGVAPVKPAEFVIIRIGLWTAFAEDNQ